MLFDRRNLVPRRRNISAKPKIGMIKTKRKVSSSNLVHDKDQIINLHRPKIMSNGFGEGILEGLQKEDTIKKDNSKLLNG